MNLTYVRKADHVDGAVIPLPAGWPAADHSEPDAAIAKEKLASGRYVKAEPLKKGESVDPAAVPTHHPHNDIVLAREPEPDVSPVPTEPSGGVK